MPCISKLTETEFYEHGTNVEQEKLIEGFIFPLLMICFCLIAGKHYSRLDFMACICMSLGLIFFTLADSKVSPQFNQTGEKVFEFYKQSYFFVIVFQFICQSGNHIFIFLLNYRSTGCQ